MRKTYNGAQTLKTSGSACLDFFAFSGAARRHPARLVRAFEKAFEEDARTALRTLLWLRDARQGAGERQAFRNILHWIAKRHPQVAAALVRSGKVQELGRWDDLFHLQGEQVWPEVLQQVFPALLEGDRLLAKWLPRKGPLAAKFCAALGASESVWRKSLAEISDTVEQRMAAADWRSIDFSSVPSVAAARLQQAFKRHAGECYAEYLTKVERGEAQMHAKAVYPHDILKAAQLNDAAATVQWSQLPRPAIAGQSILMCDVSASMLQNISGNTTAMDVCVALGLLLSESQPGPFANEVLTFSSSPSWHRIEGTTLAERAASLRGASWGGSTDLQAAFDLVLEKARQAQQAGQSFSMPTHLVVLSDMEFNSSGVNGWTNHQRIEAKFAKAGLSAPTLVFWNLNGRSGNIPACNQPGVVLVSGYSAHLAEKVLSGEFSQLTPHAMMLELVGDARYDIEGLTA